MTVHKYQHPDCDAQWALSIICSTESPLTSLQLWVLTQARILSMWNELATDIPALCPVDWLDRAESCWTCSSIVGFWLTGQSKVLLDMFQHCGLLADWTEQSPARHVPALWFVDWLDRAESCWTTNNSLLVTNISPFFFDKVKISLPCWQKGQQLSIYNQTNPVCPIPIEDPF